MIIHLIAHCPDYYGYQSEFHSGERSRGRRLSCAEVFLFPDPQRHNVFMFFLLSFLIMAIFKILAFQFMTVREKKVLTSNGTCGIPNEEAGVSMVGFNLDSGYNSDDVQKAFKCKTMIFRKFGCASLCFLFHFFN